MPAASALRNITDEDLKLAGWEARESLAAMTRLARTDPKIFAEYVYRDEQGQSIRMAPMHKTWQDLMSRHHRLVLWSHMGAGKTIQASVLRVLWEVGRNPNIRVLILSAKQDLAKKIASLISSYIENSTELHEVFPDLRKTQRSNEPWQPLSGRLTVRRPFFMKDATVTSAGVGTQILGSRFDLVLLDDVVSLENSRTKESRKLTIDWIQTNAQSRMTREGRMWIIGTAFHPEDVLHYYGKLFTELMGETMAFRYPVADEMGQPRWPLLWPKERIAVEQKLLRPVEFARQYLCEARADGDAVFKQEWIDVAIKRGAEIVPRYKLDSIPFGCVTFTGVDLAVQQKDSSDLTAIFTVMLHINKDIEILECKTGKWDGPLIIDHILDAQRRWGSLVFVENNGAQDYIMQFMPRGSLNIRGLTTGLNKLHPEYGVQGIATELYRGKWIIPSKGGLSTEMAEFVGEMLYYNPKAHTGDRLMAAFIARCGINIGEVKNETGYIPNRR